MGDRIINGFIAGVTAGIAMDIFDLFVYITKIDDVRYLDFIAVLAFGHYAKTTGEFITALLLELGFKGGLGILFVNWIPKIKSKYLYFKANLYAILIWFIVYSIIVISKATQFPSTDLVDTLSHITSCIIYGTVLSFMLIRLMNRNFN